MCAVARRASSKTFICSTSCADFGRHVRIDIPCWALENVGKASPGLKLSPTMSLMEFSVKNGALSMSSPFCLLHHCMPMRRLCRCDASSFVCWKVSQMVGMSAGVSTPQKPLSAATLFSEYSHPPTSWSSFVVPPCRATPAIVGARACTPARKLFPIFLEICSTRCRSRAPPPPACCAKSVARASSPSVILMRRSHQSRNSGSWHNAGYGVLMFSRLVSFFS